MTSATLSIDAMPRRQGWQSLYWMTPIAAVYIALTFAVPAINAGGALMVVNRLATHVFIALGLWIGLERAALTPSQRRATRLAVMIPLTLWAAVVWSAAINGFFNAGSTVFGGIPPILLVRFIPVIIAAPILLGSQRIGQVLDAIPAGWIIALQVVRLQGAQFLFGWIHQTQPAIFALPAGIADLLVGLFAVPVALALASGSRDSRRAAIAWNVFGLLDFAYSWTVSTAIFLHLIETGFSATVSGYPAVMISAFGVPQAMLLHLLSLRQLVRRIRATSR
jgi:hypothetical protein